MVSENFFYQGAIPLSNITAFLSLYVNAKSIGAYNLFIGQVRNDLIESKHVAAIDFTTYEEMAQKKTLAIIEELKRKYAVNSINVLQSLGVVKTGEICLLVLSCAGHRKSAINASQEMVERFKSEVPVWGRELFEDNSYQWKVNTK